MADGRAGFRHRFLNELLHTGLGLVEEGFGFVGRCFPLIMEATNFNLKFSRRVPHEKLPNVEGVKLKLAGGSTLVHFHLHLSSPAVQEERKKNRVDLTGSKNGHMIVRQRWSRLQIRGGPAKGPSTGSVDQRIAVNNLNISGGRDGDAIAFQNDAIGLDMLGIDDGQSFGGIAGLCSPLAYLEQVSQSNEFESLREGLLPVTKLWKKEFRIKPPRLLQLAKPGRVAYRLRELQLVQPKRALEQSLGLGVGGFSLPVGR